VIVINKDYKPLTTGGYANPKMLPQYRDRLCYLEDCIENGTLVFLPCKIGDKFWWILQKCTGEYEIVEEKVKHIRICHDGFYIIDYDGAGWYLGEIYFTKESAEKALEKMTK